MTAPSAGLCAVGSEVLLNRGSFEHPALKVVAVYLGPTADQRFHWCQVGPELVRVHEHQVSHPAPEVKS